MAQIGHGRPSKSDVLQAQQPPRSVPRQQKLLATEPVGSTTFCLRSAVESFESPFLHPRRAMRIVRSPPANQRQPRLGRKGTQRPQGRSAASPRYRSTPDDADQPIDAGGHKNWCGSASYPAPRPAAATAELVHPLATGSAHQKDCLVTYTKRVSEHKVAHWFRDCQTRRLPRAASHSDLAWFVPSCAAVPSKNSGLSVSPCLMRPAQATPPWTRIYVTGTAALDLQHLGQHS